MGRWRVGSGYGRSDSAPPLLTTSSLEAAPGHSVVSRRSERRASWHRSQTIEVVVGGLGSLRDLRWRALAASIAKLTGAVQLKSGASHKTSLTSGSSLVAVSRGARCIAAVRSESMNISMYVVTLMRGGGGKAVTLGLASARGPRGGYGHPRGALAQSVGTETTAGALGRSVGRRTSGSLRPTGSAV